MPSKPDEYEKLGSYALCGLPDDLYPTRYVEVRRGASRRRPAARSPTEGVMPPGPAAAAWRRRGGRQHDQPTGSQAADKKAVKPSRSCRPSCSRIHRRSTR